MAREVINIGTLPNDPGADDGRVGGGKINRNFAELYGNVADLQALPAGTVMRTPTYTFTFTGYDAGSENKTANLFRASSVGAHLDGPRFSQAINMEFDGSGLAAGPQCADFGLTVNVYKKNWQTSTTPGEGDAINIYGRNGTGDFAGILSNVGTINGFGAFAEAQTVRFAPGSGAVTKALRTQIGVVNSNANYEIGYVAIAQQGALTAGVQVQSESGASFVYALRNVVNGVINFAIYAADGSVDAVGGYYVSGVRVVSAQRPAIANATDAASTMARLNDLLAAARSHGLIAP